MNPHFFASMLREPPRAQKITKINLNHRKNSEQRGTYLTKIGSVPHIPHPMDLEGVYKVNKAHLATFFSLAE